MKSRLIQILVPMALLTLSNEGLGELARHPKFGFPIYTNAPSGRQLTGEHKPADNPALSPEEAQKSFVVPQGFEVRLFASEPEVVNPVAMTWDDRGRLWVLELYEYPLGATPGTRGRDRIKILEDVDADGKADKVTVYADGMSLATGLLIANGGVYVGEAPNLWFLEDTNGDDIADRKTQVLTGFGLEDRHELLNGFTWGPDGQLYMTHGVFTRTQAKNPEDPKAAPVLLTAGVARLDPKSRRFEVFAEGTSNPWGVDFDARGNAFVSACVIDHLFHLTPGGLYQRQAGQAPFPYGYGDLPSIVDHRHHMAAYAGVNIVQGSQWPEEWKGAVLHGNIHQNAINIDRLTPKGSSFVASKWTDSGDFLTTRDGWFMPVSTQTGPDGAVWIMDWYDRYPCYQNAGADPAGVDRERGRIWRVVWTGDSKGKPVASRPEKDMNLSQLSSEQLVRLLEHPNVWQRRMAQRLLNGRGSGAAESMRSLFKTGSTLESRLAALWTLHSTGALEESDLDLAADDRDPAIRAWSARLTGERSSTQNPALGRLTRLAGDADISVRVGVAVAARQLVSGALTLNTPPKIPLSQGITLGILARLFESAQKGTDSTFDFLFWMAAEPLVAQDPLLILNFYEKEGVVRDQPFYASTAHKILRRVCDLQDPVPLSRAVLAFARIPEGSPGVLVAGLNGLIEGQRGKVLTPTQEALAAMTRLTRSSNAEVAKTAQQVGSLWGDSASVLAALARLKDPSTPETDRLAAVATARKIKSDTSRQALLQVALSQGSDAVRVAAIQALMEVGSDTTATDLLKAWPTLNPAVQRAVAELCSTRGPWRWPLFQAVERGEIKRGDLPPTVIRNLATSKNDAERKKAQQLFGRVNASSADKLKLIAEKRRVVVEGAVDLEAGHRVAQKTCLVCHKMHGEGAEIGPDLTGVGRSSLDALLHNVIHPNEIIGEGYENVEVETNDGRIVNGRMIENTDSRVKLVMAGPTEVVVPKSDIRQLHVTDNSVMPEGLEQMPDADFRNLIWYILAPPQDGKPLNDTRRRELMGGSGDQTSVAPARDGESIALWAPEWQIQSPDFEDSPARFPSFAGRRNVLMTHPVDQKTPAFIARALVVPRNGRTLLKFAVAAHEQGDWELRIRVEGDLLQKQTITHQGERWKNVQVDLTSFAGRRIALRLENAANDWMYEFGYWSDLRIETDPVVQQ